MDLRIEISLRRIACISAAAVILEKELVTSKTKELFCSRKRFSYEQDKWYPFVRGVIKRISSDLLPSVLYQDLLYTVKCMGLRICGWFEYLRNSPLFGETQRNNLFENYVKKIHWTHYGTINELKIFKSYWLNNPNVDMGKIYNMACCYCLNEEEKYLWEKRNQLQNFEIESYNDQFGHIYDDIKLNILAYWDNIRNPSDTFILELSEVLVGNHIYDVNLSNEENMLRLCASQGYHIGFKYFWKQLDSGKKESNTMVCLKLILHHLVGSAGYSKVLLYNTDVYIEMCKILLQNLNGTTLKNFLSDEEFIMLFSVFSKSWPWQELLLSVLDLLLPNCDKNDYTTIFGVLASNLGEENEFNFLIESTELHRILKQLWCVTPSGYKTDIAVKVMRTFFRIWDLGIIKLVLNDKNVTDDYRECFLRVSHERLFWLIENEKIDKIEQFFCQLLVPKELNEQDHVVLKRTYRLLLRSNWDSIQIFLDFLTTRCDISKKILKEKLVTKYVIYYFIKKGELDFANQFLIWSSGSIQGFNKFRNRLIKCGFAVDHIFSIWYSSKNHLNFAVARSEKFLNFLTNFSAEEIYRFKIEKFKAVDYCHFSRLLILNLRDFNLIENFLFWCTWTRHEIDVFKKTLLWVSEQSEFDHILRRY